MTKEQQIVEIAKLDGFKLHPFFFENHLMVRDGFEVHINFFPYLTSRDAILPVIEKCHDAHLFVDVDFIQYLQIHSQWITEFNMIVRVTSAQLCEAVLRATGKWQDSISAQEER
jgi:hypothetical protein